MFEIPYYNDDLSMKLKSYNKKTNLNRGDFIEKNFSVEIVVESIIPLLDNYL